MKVSSSVRQLYLDQHAINGRLKDFVDKRIQGLKDRKWHYESRVKDLTSFALKLESGRFAEPGRLEDFFACTVVVPNAAEIARAENVAIENFSLQRKRPRREGWTHKSPEAFPFDDLRLYLTLREDPALPPTDLTNIEFELQVKTFLQHAWSIATHDLVYKTDDVNWSKERIAFQTKAMLEHAELSIQEAESLAKSSSLAKQDRRTAAIKEAIVLLKGQWPTNELPTDVRRLAENVVSLLQGLGIGAPRLEQVLEAGKLARSGSHPANLSPFATIVQYLFILEKDRMKGLLAKDPADKDTRPLRVLIPSEVEVPADLDRTQLRSAIFI